ncbi:MAG: cell division protein FtsZ [Dehalococcoidia bacterium]|jgi:cell division GTPase FtsZ|nr:cell division protein FtsZ [Chloroflexota bacterium]MCK4242930.1 cell division protein FtsZ [Dehalococcoidia bacterium]
MKLVVIGFGQCGGRIADEFYRIGRRARANRRIEIITDALAVNTDEADLSGLRNIRTDFRHRIILGGRKTGGHGVGKINELGAQIAREGSDKVIDAVRETRRFYETDAFLLIAASSGGTGSGGLPIFTQVLKERYIDKPVYALVALPFEHEEHAEERCVYNTATCLKSIYSVADAVFLIDNQRYLRKDTNLLNNMQKINQQIVEPFYNLLCTGEEKKHKHIGARIVDAGDIIQTLGGWSTIGFGKTQVSLFGRLPLPRRRSWRKKGTETHKGVAALDEALSELSVSCKPKDAGSALYLLTSPAGEANVDIVKEIGDYLKELMEEAVIRSGDYPRERAALDVTLILSHLSDIEKVRGYYYRLTESAPTTKKRQKEAELKLKEIADASKDIPSLL